MHLLAIIDTVLQVEQDRRAVDENAIRYVLAVRMFVYLTMSLPFQVRPTQLDSRDIAWAFHSESQDALIDFSNNTYGNRLLWPEAKTLGMGYWIRNVETLRRQMEIVSRNQFMHNDERDPTRCGLFYLAMKKRKLWLNLWKTAGHHPEHTAMVKFLSNDFDEQRWKSAALKNAYVLLGKQRNEYAATFFLLGEKLRDAVNVCLKQLNDPQLALVIARMYEGDDGPIYLELLHNVLEAAVGVGDRWMTSVFLSTFKRHQDSLEASFMPLEGIEIRKFTAPGESAPLSPAQLSKSDAFTSSDTDPALFLLYMHLHEDLKRRFRLPSERKSKDRVLLLKQAWNFVMDVSIEFDLKGCPLLALELLDLGASVIKADLLSENSEREIRRSMDSINDAVGTGVLDNSSSLFGGNVSSPSTLFGNTANEGVSSLFDDEPPKKTSLGLFDDDDDVNTKPKKTATSLFDEDPSQTKPSLSLFDDAPVQKPAMSLFDNDDPALGQNAVSLFASDGPKAESVNLFEAPSERKDTKDAMKWFSDPKVLAYKRRLAIRYLPVIDFRHLLFFDGA